MGDLRGAGESGCGPKKCLEGQTPAGTTVLVADVWGGETVRATVKALLKRVFA